MEECHLPFHVQCSPSSTEESSSSSSRMSSTDEDEDDGAMAHHFSGEGCFRKQNDFGRVEILEEPPRHAVVVVLLLGNRNRHEHPLKATTKPTTIAMAGCIIPLHCILDFMCPQRPCVVLS